MTLSNSPLKFLIVISSLLAFFTMHSSLAAEPSKEFDIECPPTFSAVENAISVPEGWTPYFEKATHRFTGIEFSSSTGVNPFKGEESEDENPIPRIRQDASIAADPTGGVIYTWLFDDRSATYTLRCLYSGTFGEWVKPLPQALKACQVKQTDKQGKLRAEIRCFP